MTVIKFEYQWDEPQKSILTECRVFTRPLLNIIHVKHVRDTITAKNTELLLGFIEVGEMLVKMKPSHSQLSQRQASKFTKIIVHLQKFYTTEENVMLILAYIVGKRMSLTSL